MKTQSWAIQHWKPFLYEVTGGCSQKENNKEDLLLLLQTRTTTGLWKSFTGNPGNTCRILVFKAQSKGSWKFVKHHLLSPLDQEISFRLHILSVQIPCNFTPVFSPLWSMVPLIPLCEQYFSCQGGLMPSGQPAVLRDLQVKIKLSGSSGLL